MENLTIQKLRTFLFIHLFAHPFLSSPKTFHFGVQLYPQKMPNLNYCHNNAGHESTSIDFLVYAAAFSFLSVQLQLLLFVPLSLSCSFCSSICRCAALVRNSAFVVSGLGFYKQPGKSVF